MKFYVEGRVFDDLDQAIAFAQGKSDDYQRQVDVMIGPIYSTTPGESDGE